MSLSLPLWSLVGLLVAGFPGAVTGVFAAWWWARRKMRPAPPPHRRLVMMLLLVELRSGMSVLASLQRVSAQLPGYAALDRVARVASVSGLTVAITEADDQLRPVAAQLARAQVSGSSLVSAILKMLEQDLAQMRARRLSRARTLPVRLMIPVTLLMLPGLVLLLYGPALIRTFDQLTGSWP